MSSWVQNFGSFRDPAGGVWEVGDEIYRTVQSVGKENYQHFVESGLSEQLQTAGWLIPFVECELPSDRPHEEGVWKYLRVEKVPFLSWPYEWSFHQLRDSAILTLKIELAALKKGMTLKDASAYNVQMYRGRPIFIDILSFEKYQDGSPWAAYRQFVMHFLGPLLLMSQKDLRFSALFRDWVDGFPVDFVSRNLPWSSRWSLSSLIHVHWHAKLLRKYESTRGNVPKKIGTLSQKQLIRMLEGLLDWVQRIKAPYPPTEWGDYYNDTNYSEQAFQCKKELVGSICQTLRPQKVCDLGANCGEFSRALPTDIPVIVSADIDPVAVDKNYVQVRRQKEKHIYPILQDLCNPSPGIGWMNQERASFLERGQCDLALGLALIHHLCIGNNLPMDYVAQFFRKLSSHAVIEFVPKEDSQVQRLLSSREDIFPQYRLEYCIQTFRKYYAHLETYPVGDSLRTLLYFRDSK